MSCTYMHAAANVDWAGGAEAGSLDRRLRSHRDRLPPQALPIWLSPVKLRAVTGLNCRAVSRPTGEPPGRSWIPRQIAQGLLDVWILFICARVYAGDVPAIPIALAELLGIHRISQGMRHTRVRDSCISCVSGMPVCECRSVCLSIEGQTM